MELRHLRYFAAVVEAGSFGRAAERLHLAQPALSRQVRDLEAEIGVVLLERLPRGIRPTAAGATFAEEARQLLNAATRAVARARRIAEGAAGRLRIGFIASAGWRGIVPAAIKGCRDRFPEVRLELQPASSLGLLEAVRAGTLDAAFLYNRPDDPELGYLPAARHMVVLSLPSRHPRLKQRRLQLGDLVEEPFVLFPRHVAPVYFDRLMAACARGGLRPNVVQEAPDEPAMLSLVAAGLGIAFVNQTVRWHRPEGVALREVADLNVWVELDLVWRADNALPALARFLELAKQIAVGDLPFQSSKRAR
jgi:DNA-binding transcriptional LysR family regulator